MANGNDPNNRVTAPNFADTFKAEVDKLTTVAQAAQPSVGGQVVSQPLDNCPLEQRQVNNNTGAPLESDGSGDTMVLLFTRPSGGTVEVIEVSMQTEQDTHLQLFEGGSPITATRFVQQNLLWSTPGKVINANLYLLITEASALVDVDVRYIVR